MAFIEDCIYKMYTAFTDTLNAILNSYTVNCEKPKYILDSNMT